MIAFEVSVNGERLCVAGAADLGVVTANLFWVRRRPLEPDGINPDWVQEEMELDVGGIDTLANEHLRWIQQTVSVGDEIRIRIIEADQVDEVVQRYPCDRPPPPWR